MYADDTQNLNVKLQANKDEEANTSKTEWREKIKSEFLSTQMSKWKVSKSKGLRLLMFTILLLIWLSFIKFSASSRKTKLNSVRYAWRFSHVRLISWLHEDSNQNTLTDKPDF